MRFLPLLIFFLLSLTAAGQNAIIRGSKEIVLTPYNETGPNAHVNIQFKDSTKYKTAGFWRNRGNGYGYWGTGVDSTWKSNDTLYIRAYPGPVVQGYKLGGGSSTFDTTAIYDALSTKVGYGEMGAILAPFMFTEDTLPIHAAIVANAAAIATKLPIADTNNMLAGYVRKATSNVLTDAATIVWNYSTTVSPEVTIAGNRTLSITNLPTTAGIVVYGCLLVSQDATGGRDLYPPATISRGFGGMGLASGNPFPLDKTSNAKNEVCFEYRQAQNIIYWAVGKKAD